MSTDCGWCLAHHYRFLGGFAILEQQEYIDKYGARRIQTLLDHAKDLSQNVQAMLKDHSIPSAYIQFPGPNPVDQYMSIDGQNTGVITTAEAGSILLEWYALADHESNIYFHKKGRIPRWHG